MKTTFFTGFIYCLLTLIFFGFFFNPKFVFLGFGAFYPSVVILVILGMVGLVYIEKAPSALFVVIWPIYFALTLAMISLGVNYPDIDYFLVGAFFCMAVVGSISFGFFSLFSRIDGQPLLVSAIAAFTLNAVLMIIMFVSSTFQLWYLNLLTNEGVSIFGGADNALDSLYRFRMIGANGFASYSAGFAQVIGLFFLVIYYKILNKRLDILFLAISILLLISALLSARSAIFGILLWFIFCFTFFRWQFFIIFSYAFIILTFLLVAMVGLMDVEGADYFTKWILDIFFSGADSESLTENIKMLEIPFLDAGLFGFSRWFGDFGDDYFRAADVGFIRLILAGGFTALFLVFMHFLLMGLLFFHKNSCIFFNTLFIFLIFYLVVMMVKGAILFDFFAFDFLLLMLCWFSTQKNNFEDANENTDSNR